MAPDMNQRVQVFEEKLTATHDMIRSTVAGEVSAALKADVTAMEQALANRFLSCVEETMKKQESKLEETAIRLEGHISRSREHQESLITSIRDTQEKFQREIRSVVSGILPMPTDPTKTLGKSINQGGLQGFGTFGGLNTGESSNSGGPPFGDIEVGSGGGPGGGMGTNGGFTGWANWRYKKLDLPLFDGTNPDGWILWAERYFNFYCLSEEEKIEATVVALEGQALIWFQWEHRRRPTERWEQVKTLLRRQFRSLTAGTLQEQWLGHNQEGTVTEYRLKFIELLAPLENVSEELALGQFLNALKSEIRAEVRLLGPVSVDHAMELALMVVDKLRLGYIHKGDWRGSTSTNNRSSFGSG